MTNQIREVKEATDIVQIIGEKVQLQRAGRNLKANCPFHSEKSPSFFVSPDIQVYRCFGCGESGDVFTFLQKYEGLTFAESLKVLADRAGIQLQQVNFTPEDDQRQRMFDILHLARDYYHYLFTQHQIGEIAREYVKDRKIFADIIKEFQIGYSLPAWDGLIKYLVGKKKFAIEDLDAAGLIILRNGAPKGSKNPRDYYDRFRGRLMFPLTDHRGRVVGFSGRILDKDTKDAKYINSPETKLYHKSQLLFGYSQLYRSIREAGQVVVVEGEFDVLSSVQAHVRNVVAIKGSALTKEHVARLKQVVDTIILSLDADKAGIEATKRAIEIAKPFEMRLKVLQNQNLGGKDPDDVARENPKLWREHVKSAVSAYQFLIDSAFAEEDPKTGEGKQAIVKELAPVLSMIPHAVERAHYTTAVAVRLGVPESILQQDIQQYQKAQTLSSLPNRTALPNAKEAPKKETPLDIVERHLLHVLLNIPEKDVVEHARKVTVTDITHPGIHRIIKQLQLWSTPFSVAKFSTTVDSELQPLLTQAYLESEPNQDDSVKEFDDIMKRHQQLVMQERMKAVTLKLEYLDAIEDKTPEQEAEHSELLQQMVKMQAQSVRY